VAGRTLTADRVVLSGTRHDPARRTAAGLFVELTEAGGVRLRPWSIRYAAPAELEASNLRDLGQSARQSRHQPQAVFG
jgi:hypothetical protein